VKLGCFGCFFLVVLVLVGLVLGAGALFVSHNIFETPDIRPVSFSRDDGYAAQQKLYEIALRQAGRSNRRDPISLSEREVTAFLSRHLDKTSRVPLSDLTVRFDSDEFVAQGQASLRSLIQGGVFSYILSYIPDGRLDRPVWVSVRGTVSIETPALETRQYGKVSVSEFALGRQPVNAFLVYVLMGPSGSGLLEWVVPDVVQSIQIHRGQAIIRTRH
jgi:hypothetical protein